MIKAIFFDVDGTLLSHKTKRIPRDTEEALAELRQKEIKIFMSTGRHSTELAQLPVNHIPFDGYITLNGQICLDENKRKVCGMPFGERITEKLVSVFEQKKYPLALVEAERIYINFVNDTVRKAQESISTPVPEVSVYRNGDIYLATAFLDREEEAAIQEDLPEGCRIVRWNEYGTDIISTEGGKMSGITYFCEHCGISQEEIMAFGDAENDIDMLEAAGIGVAMGNAQDSVKAISDYVTEDVDLGGIAQALRYFQIIS